jgi:hypothetical protein
VRAIEGQQQLLRGAFRSRSGALAGDRGLGLTEEQVRQSI